MAGCAGSMLLTGLSRISPEIQGKKQGEKQGENCPGTGTCLWPSLWQDAGPQFPAGLLFLRGTDLRSECRARVLPGCWQPA